MKSIKYLVWSFLAAGVLFTACTDDDTYEPGAPESGSSVGFPVEVTTSYVVSDNTSIEIPVLRDKTDDALTVNVIAETAASFINVPSQVSFAVGQSSTPLTITFDLDKFEYDSSHKIELTLDSGANATEYKPQVLSVTVSRPAPWVSLGMATYTDDFMTTFFSVDNETYEVEIQENQNIPGLYRLVNPYGEAYPNNDPGDWDESQDYYMEIHAEDPDAVWIPVSRMGFDWGYGEFYMGSIAGLYIGNGSSTVEQQKAAGNCGTLKDGVFSFPAKMLLIAMADYNDGGLYTANSTGDGMFRIVLPGYTVADTSVGIELTGYFKDLSEANFAVVDVTLGEDVENVLLASAVTTDFDGLRNAIIDGSIETVSATASGAVNVPVADGKNTIVAVSYANGEPQDYDYITFSFYAGVAPELSPLETDWTADDMYGIEKSELFKRWIMWGVDYYDEDGNTDRQPLSYVTFAESDETYEDEYGEYDLITISGFSVGMSSNDTHFWEYYGGFIYNWYLTENLGQVQMNNGARYYLNCIPFASSGAAYGFYDEMMVGGLVADGYMALAYSQIYQLGSNPEPNGFLYKVYNDVNCESAVGNVAAYYNIMFEDPTVSALSNVTKPVHVTTVENLNTLASQMKTPANYVELRGRARAHALIDELNAKNAAKKASKLQIVDRKGQNNGRTLKLNAQAL